MASLKEVLIEEKDLFWNRLEPDLRRFRREIRHPRTWAYIAGLILAAALLISAITYVAFAQDLVTKERLVNAKNAGTILYDRSGKVLYTTQGAHDVRYVPFDKIPSNLKKATISIEDREFYQHGGFSGQAILRSIYANFLNGDPTRYGGSTITQQLVKNALLSPSKDFLRKFQEFVLSVEVERRFSKDEILEMYLNSVYYGAGAYGVGNAAQSYFGKDIGSIDLAQAAELAALPVAPSALSPTAGGDKDAAKKRQELVLDKMSEQGYITVSERDLAKKEVLSFQPYQQAALNISPHFALYVLDLLRSQYGEDYVGRAGLRVTTTLDLDLEKIAEKLVADHVKSLSGNHVSNGGLVSINPKTGEVLAMVGSADYGNDEIGGKLNIAFADRQPGSAFKPIVYLKAIESRSYTAATVLHDTLTDFGGGYKPTDYDGLFRGDILARFALAESLNIPAVELLRGVGVDSALEMAHRLKISTLQNRDQYGLSLVLGGGEVKLFEMARAYGVMANYGNYVETTPVLKITDHDGNQIFVANPRKENLVDPQYTYILSNILADNEAKLPTFGSFGVYSLTIPGHKAAVKTGTTEHFRDGWTIGFTPNLVTGVWVGNNDGSFMDQVAGSLGAAPIWRDFMRAAGDKLGWEDFRVPAGIQTQLVCRSNGLKSHGTSGSTYTEAFALGTVPSGFCDEETPPVATPSATPAAEPKKEATGAGTDVSSGSATTPATGSGVPIP